MTLDTWDFTSTEQVHGTYMQRRCARKPKRPWELIEGYSLKKISVYRQR
jgi:hypothetical protein